MTKAHTCNCSELIFTRPKKHVTRLCGKTETGIGGFNRVETTSRSTIQFRKHRFCVAVKTHILKANPRNTLGGGRRVVAEVPQTIIALAAAGGLKRLGLMLLLLRVFSNVNWM